MPIRDQTTFEGLLDRCRKHGVFGFDTEFIRERRFAPRLCLIQVALPGETAVIDPFGLDDLEPLVALLADAGVCKVLHAGQQDMEIFFSERREVPKRIFDTQIAAALLGHGDSIGYSRLVERVLGATISKAETFTDWARRPLSKRQIEYALADVGHLLALEERLSSELADRGRTSWLEEELKVYEDPGFYRRDPATAYLRVKGAARLDRKGLAVLQALAAWREEEAQRIDKPRGHVLSDDILVELVRAEPTSVETLHAFRGLRPPLVRRSGGEIVKRTREALRAPPEDLPPAIERPSRDPELSLVVDLLEAFLKARAQDLEVSPGMLTGRSELHELVRRERDGVPVGEEIRVLRGWRRGLIGEDLLGLLEGRYSLAIEPRTGHVVVRALGGEPHP